MKRKGIIVSLSVIVFSIIATVVIANMKDRPERKNEIEEKVTVQTQEVKNEQLNITIQVIGKLIAHQKVEIYAEVSGVLKTGNKSFLEGISYKKGETMLKINADETFTSLIAKKSSFVKLLSGIIPDLRFDYPESYKNWETYLYGFDIRKSIAKLPTPLNDQEKFYLTGKGVYQNYYDILSLEKRLDKYTLKAPFNGEVIQSLIKPGTLVRNGQKLGEFINPFNYDLETTVSLKDIAQIKEGDKVKLRSEVLDDKWDGKVSRISSSIDNQTQTVKIYISVSGKNLKEGMFLQGELSSKKEVNAIEIPRRLLIEENKVLVVENDTIKKKKINILHYTSENVLINGLKDGTMLCQNTQNLEPGMKVEINTPKLETRN